MRGENQDPEGGSLDGDDRTFWGVIYPRGQNITHCLVKFCGVGRTGVRIQWVPDRIMPGTKWVECTFHSLHQTEEAEVECFGHETKKS